MNQKQLEMLKNATILANDKIMQIRLLPYYNGINFEKNTRTIKRNLVDDQNREFFADSQIALYISNTNSVYYNEQVLLNDKLDSEKVALSLLHEYLHMASTNAETNTIGFSDSILPITYNEACTQWLTLKLFYGEENLERSIAENFMYPESVKLIDEMIKEIGEETVFNGFFDANCIKNAQEMSEDKKSKWIDYIVKFSFSQEEKKSQESMQNLNAKL